MIDEAHPSRETYRAEVVGSVAVCAHLRGEPNGAMAWLSDNVARMCRTGADVGAVLILKEGARPPDDEKRKQFIGVLRTPSVKGVAVVVLGGGFWAAAARSVVTFFVVSARLPIKLFTDGDSARAWLVERLGSEVVDQRALEATVNALIDAT